MSLTLEVTYADRGGLKHALESQLARGGLYVAVDASALPPLGELTLRVCAPDGFAAEAPARLTVAAAEAACVEIAAAALGELVAAVAAHTADATAQAGEVSAAILDSSRREEDAPDTRGQISLERKIAVMAVGEKVQLALHGNRDARQLLMRERAGVVQSSLVRTSKITLDEVQALARAPQLAPDTAETLAQHPVYGASPQIAMALVRNPRTPLPIATQLVAKLGPADLRTVAKGLGVRMQVAAVARKRLVER
jgi:hypothetical protein